ncbi:MAG: TrkH family potassium uptake protein [Tissierellia bacterium]|nr:TrkH family potassium uptake protein [Tissierellia bacterium]
MNYNIVRYVLAKLLRIEAALLILPLTVGLIYKEAASDILAYVFTIVLLILVSTLLYRKKLADHHFYMREAFVIVGMSWILLSFFGSLPFYFSGQIPNLVDCFFETSSGFTTTGSSILKDVEALSHSMLFWRSFTHVIGGMGILVFALAILPKIPTDSLRMIKAEVPGPSFGKLVSKLSVTARILYVIYIAMTAIVVVFLLIGGMNLFDALIHAFGAAGTGGFSNKALSVGYYNSTYIEIVLGISMLMFGTNFNLHYLFLFGNKKDILKNEELRWYLLIALVAIVAISLNIQDLYGGLSSLRHSFFTVSSIITTTGFGTANFGAWPLFSKLILLSLMCIGASAGSTAGGLKVSRVVVLVKSALTEIKRIRQPKRIVRLTQDGRAVSEQGALSILNYFMLYVIIVLVLILIISLDLQDLESATSAVLATFNNIGPGLGLVGPTANYSGLSDFSKLLLSFAMIAGRLEIFPIFILFLPATWKKIL